MVLYMIWYDKLTSILGKKTCYSIINVTIPMAVLSKARFYGRSPLGITGSNLAEDMCVCLMRVLCVN